MSELNLFDAYYKKWTKMEAKLNKKIEANPKKGNKKLAVKCQELIDKMKESAELEIQKFETKPQIQEITKFLVDRFSFLIRRADRANKYPSICVTFDFMVECNQVYYLEEYFNYGDRDWRRVCFNFNDHRIEDLSEKQVFIVTQTLLVAIEKELRKLSPKDSSGTEYEIITNFREKLCNYVEDFSNYNNSPSHHRYYFVNSTMTYTAKNGYYEEKSTWYAC